MVLIISENVCGIFKNFTDPYGLFSYRTDLVHSTFIISQLYFHLKDLYP